MATSTFPEGWFFIKNLSNGYVLMVDSATTDAGSNVVISSLRTKDADPQLWRHDQGYLYNKKTGLVIDVAKGNAKAGSEIVQQSVSNAKAENNCQTYGITPEGHIFLKQKPSLVLGIKESFFSRREGLHVHLQLVDKRYQERKEQRWEFIVPVIKQVSVTSSTTLKRSVSGSTEGSGKPLGRDVSQIKDDDARSVLSTSSSIDHEESQRIPSGTFPDTSFFIKSQANGFYIGTEAASISKPGGRLTIDSLRKSAYDSQLWTYDITTSRIINVHSGFVLGIENNTLTEDAYLCQSAPIESSLKTQTWSLSGEGEVCLKSDAAWVLGYKDSWFNSREGAHLHIQKKTKGSQFQKFSVVLPVFKKRVSEITTTAEQTAEFPEGWFFMKSQAEGLVLTVLESGTLSAQAVAVKLDTGNYARQLWKHSNGFLINRASEMALDVKHGSLVSGSEVCQYTQKTSDNANQLWGYNTDGTIFIKAKSSLVLSVKAHEKNKSNVFLTAKSSDHKEQRWQFVLPVFKKKQITREVSTSKTVKYRYAQYPAGWFFIRSHHTSSTKESPLVLTADKTSQSVHIVRLDRENWKTQLWTYSNGSLVNYATEFAIDVKDSKILQSTTQEIKTQHWSLTVEGYLVNEANSSHALILQEQNNSYSLGVGEHGSKQEHRWGLMVPTFGYKSNVQILVDWSIVYLKEWRRSASQSVQKITHRLASWPEEVFYLRAHDNLAIVPQSSEAYSVLVLKQLEASNAAEFQWTFRNQRLVHVASGLVLGSDMVHGSSLQLTVENANDIKQQWALKTDGSIVLASREEYGFGLVQKNGSWTLQLIQVTKATHYGWTLMYGHYESSTLRFRRIILTLLSTKSTADRQLVTHRYGVFPKTWFFVRSKADESLVLTVSNEKQGSKIVLEKLDFKIFRRQLWQCRDDGCLYNMETDYVIDVAGGALSANSNIIQWHEKTLRRNRKNQMWGLTIEGHIHPQSRNGLVLGFKSDKAQQGSEVILRPRGAAHLTSQQWSFASPVFGKRTGGTQTISRTDKTLTLESVDKVDVKVDEAERYQRTSQRTVVRRWGVFPDQHFFVRSSYGKDKLALTVVESSKQQVEGRVEYNVTLQALNLKAYTWQFWTYEEGHLINKATGLALDSEVMKGAVVESGFHSQLRVREVSSAETQFWGLTIEGAIHQKANARLIVGVSSVEKVNANGSQIGLREMNVNTNATNDDVESQVQSEEWLRWAFSKPLFGKRVITSTTSTSTTGTEGAAQEVEGTVLSVEETKVDVEEHKEEEEEESSEEEDNDEHLEETHDLEEQLSPEPTISEVPQSRTVETVRTDVALTKSISTESIDTLASVPVKSGIKPIESVVDTTSQQQSDPQPQHSVSVKKSNSSKSIRVNRKDSFQLKEDYVPTGYEKVVRYKTHQGTFPTGYFLIKSHLHGYVLDIDGDAIDDANVILTRIKSTDFASQMWTYRDGLLVSLKNPSLVLDGAKLSIMSGEQAHLSLQTTEEKPEDRVWDHTSEYGVICLRAKRSLVLTVKEVRRNEAEDIFDVFVQEEKVHKTQKEARREQRWEILIPSLIPVAQPKEGVKVVEAGKVSTVSSSASAILAYKCLKETFHYKITSENQWPSSEKWFFIRYGAQDQFLAADENKQVGVYTMEESQDYKRFLWIHVNGYLINYKYMLRLVFLNQKWTLSDSTEQTFNISSKGVLSVSIMNVIYYLRIIRHTTTYELTASTEVPTEESTLQLHLPVFSDKETEKLSQYASTTAVTMVQQPQRTTTITTTVRRAFFPDAAWFFIKVDSKEHDLVLTVENNSATTGSNLVVKKLDFQTFKSQLWTFRDGLLINYGSKLVIDVHGNINPAAHLIQSVEAGVSSQKWALTVDGEIHLESHSDLVLGYQGKQVEENTKVVLATKKNKSTQETTIQWKFATPIFGSKTSQTTTETSKIGGVTEAIEQGSVITKTEQVPVKMLDIVKEITPKGEVTTKTTRVGDAPQSPVSTNKTKTFHHTDVDQLHKRKDKVKTTLARTNYKTSQVVIQETQYIIRAWRIVFLQRIQRCTTQQEITRVIEESRRVLYQRLDANVKISVKQVAASDVKPHETVEQVKTLYNTRVFEFLLQKVKGYKPDQKVSIKELNVENTLKETTEEVERHFGKVIVSKPKPTQVTEYDQSSETKVVTIQRTLVTVQTIRITVRYWYIQLFSTITEAKKNGATEHDIKKLIETAHGELNTKLQNIKKDTCKHIQEIPNANVKVIEESVTKAIERTQEIVKQQTETIHTVSQPKSVEEIDTFVIANEETLKKELKDCESVITTEVADAEEIESDEEDVETIVKDTEEIKAIRQTVADKIDTTKTEVTQWFGQVTEDITSCIKDTNTNKEDTLAVIDAAEHEIISKIDDAITTITTQYRTVQYMTIIQYRRIIYSLETTKTSLRENITRFRTVVNNNDIPKQEIHRYITYSFGPSTQKSVITEIEETSVNVTKPKPTDNIKYKLGGHKTSKVITKIGIPEQKPIEETESPVQSKTEQSTHHVITKIGIPLQKTDETNSKTTIVKETATIVAGAAAVLATAAIKYQTDKHEQKPTVVEEVKKTVEHVEHKPTVVEEVKKTVEHVEHKPTVVKEVKKTVEHVEHKPTVVEEVKKTVEHVEHKPTVVEEVKKTVEHVDHKPTVVEEVKKTVEHVEHKPTQQKPTVVEEVKKTVVVEGVKVVHEKPTVVHDTKVVKDVTETIVVEGIKVVEHEKPTVVTKETTKGSVVVVENVEVVSHKPVVKDITTVFQEKEKTTVVVEGIRVTGKKPTIVTKETKEGTIVVIEDVEFTTEKPTVVRDVTKVIKDTESTALVLEGIETIGEKPVFTVKDTIHGRVIVVEGVKVVHDKPTVKDIKTVIKEITETAVVVEGVKVVETVKQPTKIIDNVVTKTDRSIVSHGNDVIIHEDSEHGLGIIEETTKVVSGWLSGLTHRFVSAPKLNDVDGTPAMESVAVASEKELDRICEEAKMKLVSNVSTTTGRAPTKEEHVELVKAIESMKSTAKLSLVEVKEVAIVHKDKPEILAKKLQAVTDKSHHHISSHYDAARSVIVEEQAKRLDVKKVIKPIGDHKVEKVLAGVVAGAVIASEIKKALPVDKVANTVVVEKKTTAKDMDRIAIVRHEEAQKKVASNRKDAEKKTVCGKKRNDQVVAVIDTSKTTVVGWFTLLIEQISTRVKKGGENVEADIAILIKEKKEHLLKTLKDSHESVKIEFESDSIEHDNSGLLVQAHFEESLKVIETTVNKRIVEIQETVRTQPKSTDKLQTILNSTKEEIIVTLEDTQRSTVEIIEADSKKADSVLVVVDTVDSVKKTIGSWYGRLTLEIGTILASSDCDKEKKVDELVKKANEEITVVISDAKLNIANASKAIKDTAVSTMGDIAIVLDQIQSNVAAQVIQIQEVSRNNAGQPVEEVKKTLSKIIQESEKKIDFDLSGSVAAVVSTTKSTVVVGVEDSVNTISRWFRGFTSKVAGLVKQESSTVDSISETSKNAQVEIEKIIAKATVEFEEHLVKQNLDKVASELARNEYLKSLQTAKNTITAQIVQVEKTVVDAHKAGKTIDVEKQLIEWNDASDDNLKVVFDSNIVITKETDVEKPNQSIIKATVIEENVVLDTKDVKSKEVIVEDKPVELVEKIVEELRVVDVSTTVPNMVTSEIKKQVTVNTDVKLIEIIKEDDFTLDVVKKTVSYWFYYLIEDISVRTKAGVAKEEITQTVEKAQKELVVILEQAKTAGVKYCKSEQDKAYYMEQISWISTNVNAQAVQIEQVAVQATATKSDVKEHMQVLADNASKHVETAFEKVKSVVVFTESKVTQGVSNVTKSLVKHEHKDVEKAKKAQKAVVAVYENTRNASVSWFTIVCQKISDRVKQGGANVEKDIKYIVETAEKDITSVLQKSSVQKIEGVEEIEVKVQMDQAITSAKKTMEVQLLTIKNAAATISSDNSPKASEQLLKICDHSKKEIEDFFVTAVKTVDVVDAEKIEVVENKTSVVQVVKDDVVQVVEVPEEKSVISEITRDIKEQEVALVQTAQDATETVRSWFSVLVEKITALQGQECGDEKTVEKTNAAIVEAQKEIAVKIIELKETAKSQRGVSDKQAHTDSQLDLFFGNLKSTIDNQINVVKSTILEGPTESKESIKTSLQAAAHKLNNEVVTHFDVIQTTNTPVVETKVKRQIVQVIEAPKVQKVQSTISDWYIVLTKRINERINRGGENVTEDVKLITQEAQKELDVTITEAKKSETSQVDVVKQDRAEGQRSFSATLEWIRWNATAQINQINEIASKENISKNNMQAQIENYALVAKQQVGNALTVHAPVKSVEVISEVVRKGSIGEVVIIEETKEQVQERTRKEMTLVVEETKTKLVGWLDALLISTRDIVRVGGANCKQEVALLIKNSEEEATRLVQDAKIKFTTANTSASVHSTETAALIIHAQKQALDCLDSIRETIHSRVTVIEEVVHSEDLTNFELIDQKLISTVTRAKNQLQIVLNSATEKSIAAVFEGRTITWTKSLEIPHSFKDVRVFAFDVTGTAVDYRSTLLKAWRTITVSKQDQLHGFDVQAFIIQWYKFYTIERAVSVRTISDAAVFRLVLIRLLKEKSLEHLFTETEITTLCSFWFRLDLFADTASSVSSIKKQSGMYTVAFSPDLSTRSMVDLARHGCLCWHAQFTSEMFHATTDGSSTEVVVSGTTEILALEHPGQLAVVSANPLVLEAARKQGSRTVLLDRYEEKYEGKFDLKAEGLDVLAQSFQSFLEE